ncbi:MAG: usg protein [Hyphomonas sp.]|nr:usg protein [Hyphomonas sp.]
MTHVPRNVSPEFRKALDGYGLTTAHIFYRRPDRPWLLQSYVWQDYDLAPKFPELYRFLDFWEQKLDGRLHSVQVAHEKLIRPGEFRHVAGEWRLH